MKHATLGNPVLIPWHWLLSSKKLVLQWSALQSHRRCSPFCVGEECEDIRVCTLRYQQTHTRMWGPAKGCETQRVKSQIKYHFVSCSQTWALHACVILAFICVQQCHLQTHWTNAAAPGTESSELRRGYCPTVLKPEPLTNDNSLSSPACFYEDSGSNEASTIGHYQPRRDFKTCVSEARLNEGEELDCG